MRCDVDGLMKGGLGEWLAGQETMRAAAKEQAASRWTWGTALLLPVLAFVVFGPNLPFNLAIIIVGGAVALVFYWGYRPIAAAKRAIKVGINSAIADSFGVTYSHDCEPGAEFEAAKTYGLLPSYDRSTFEDRWHGALEGHAFGLYEAHLEEQRGSGKKRRLVTVFRGSLITMAFGRAFGSTTLLERSGKHRSWLGLGGASDHVNFDGHRLDRIDQVHPAFADVFALYSDDTVEARVLVHPSYVEHLLRIESVFAARELRALFRDGKVIIALETDNLFESGAMEAATDRARVEQAAQQFAALGELALAINQNERGRTLRPEPQAPEGL